MGGSWTPPPTYTLVLSLCQRQSAQKKKLALNGPAPNAPETIFVSRKPQKKNFPIISEGGGVWGPPLPH